ncbi:hypothetical protein H0S57_08675 [Acinetobacter johnsonii]|uniref:hypothetical protein n=1 Tax=Acinetobacter johnsonii TaxID=40214 RepID=UPI0018A07252|nr:hypothetical protein [Acinetobacter johnsonii]QPF33600.1 hypothetical protein H0S57_08675 [Acinetobacter johnsonii]
MAHEKRTSVKILTSTKKKNISPMLYAFGGFLSGVVLMATLGFTYFFTQQKNDSIHVSQSSSVDVAELSVDNEAPTREPEAIFEATKIVPSKSVQPSNVTEPPSDFPQPKEDELSRAFLRPTQTVVAPSMKSASPQPLPKENKKQNSSTQSLAALQDKNHNKVAKAEQTVEESPTGSVQTKITTRTVEAPMPATIRL